MKKCRCIVAVRSIDTECALINQSATLGWVKSLSLSLHQCVPFGQFIGAVHHFSLALCRCQCRALIQWVSGKVKKKRKTDNRFGDGADGCPVSLGWPLSWLLSAVATPQHTRTHHLHHPREWMEEGTVVSTLHCPPPLLISHNLQCPFTSPGQVTVRGPGTEWVKRDAQVWQVSSAHRPSVVLSTGHQH